MTRWEIVMGSRDAILAALGPRVLPSDADVPRWAGKAVSFDDPVAAFRESLAAAGGSLVELADRTALEAAIAAAPPDTVVLRGGPAVAESGAVWWMPADPGERPRTFLAERVAIAVAREELVDDLHAAYRRIDPAAAPWGGFVSGPSKTADIEQALVIGAHGPKEWEVWLWGGRDR